MSKVIIITGASRGLGNAIAKAILELSPDHKVFLVSRSLDELHALQTHYGADRVGYKSLDLTNLTVHILRSHHSPVSSMTNTVS